MKSISNVKAEVLGKIIPKYSKELLYATTHSECEQHTSAMIKSI